MKALLTVAALFVSIHCIGQDSLCSQTRIGKLFPTTRGSSNFLQSIGESVGDSMVMVSFIRVAQTKNVITLCSYIVREKWFFFTTLTLMER